jgi:transcription elongation factor Elf1
MLKLIARVRRFFHCLRHAHKHPAHCAVDYRSGTGVCVACTCGRIFYITDL